MADDRRETLAELYEQFRYDCLHVAMGILRNQHLAEDAVHDAFLSVIEHEKYLSLDCRDFRRLIVIIVKRKCFDILRKNKKTSEAPPDGTPEIPAADAGSPEALAIRESDARALRRGLEKLGEPGRQLLEMKYVQGMTYKEIGETLGISVKNVEVSISRAKKKMRKLLENDL
jgi:RNA polymerase sigma-70 factor (ECF subfamily)